MFNISVRSSFGARQRDVGGISHVCGSMGHLTALGARTLAWPQGANLAEQDPRKPIFGKQGTLCRGSTSRQTMEACHSCSDTRGTSVFSWPPSTNTKRLSWNTVSSIGSRNEAVAVPNTLAEICGREVTVFHFVGGATLVEALYAAFADFQEDMKQKRPDTLQRYNQVLATLNGGLMDVTLLDERTSPDVLDHST